MVDSLLAIYAKYRFVIYTQVKSMLLQSFNIDVLVIGNNHLTPKIKVWFFLCWGCLSKIYHVIRTIFTLVFRCFLIAWLLIFLYGDKLFINHLFWELFERILTSSKSVSGVSHNLSFWPKIVTKWIVFLKICAGFVSLFSCLATVVNWKVNLVPLPSFDSKMISPLNPLAIC